jgi:hypothetical protein
VGLVVLRLRPEWQTQLELDTLAVRTAPGIVIQVYLLTLLATLALVLGTRIASWFFWTSKTDDIAAIGRGLAIVAGVAGLLENVVLHVWAGEPIQPGTSPPWSVQLAASLATLKWSALLPAAVAATVGVLVCLSRLIRYGLSRIPTGGRAARETIGTALRMPTPREEASAALDDLPTEARGVKRLFYRSWGEPVEEKASPKRVNGVKEDREARWRQAYDVPSVTQERLQALNDGGHATGFALSGGGIRSGTLALGSSTHYGPS